MIKGSVQGAVKTIVNTYGPNRGAPQYLRQLLTSIKGEINSNTMGGGVNTQFTKIETNQKEKTHKKKANY